MATYQDIIELVGKREMGILGRQKTKAVFREIGLEIGEDGSVSGYPVDLNALDTLMNLLNDKYGPVPVMGCKIAVLRLARKGGLEPPAILK
ncbi:hypothetical protein MNBD_NITROSPINAE02-1231 [hydrothermal vent metagenome]|uniref:Uncharacterized protein n=1 Tax=hydrothermal vent metagenome TaxID=652676 RepID=A0A3B1CU09_9ZZZZ